MPLEACLITKGEATGNRGHGNHQVRHYCSLGHKQPKSGASRDVIFFDRGRGWRLYRVMPDRRCCESWTPQDPVVLEATGSQVVSALRSSDQRALLTQLALI